jgi:hypothetical protein
MTIQVDRAKQLLAIAVRQSREGPRFFECGCCGHMHSPDFWGDCRQDSERFTCMELDEVFGENAWEEVEQESAW